MEQVQTDYDRFANDSFEFWRTYTSKYAKDQSKAGVRSYASSCLDDFLRYHCDLNNIDIEIITSEGSQRVAINLTDSFDMNINHGSAYYGKLEPGSNEVSFKADRDLPLKPQNIEMLEDLMRMVYKYEIGFASAEYLELLQRRQYEQEKTSE